MSLARWQGGVDAALRSHEERLNLTAADIRATRDTMQALRDDVREIKRATSDRASDNRFRWTRWSVIIAGAALVATLALNLYFSTHH